MKLNKIFAIALAALTMTACSDDDDFNSVSGVSVQMKNATMEVRENGNIFNVPFEVTGEANGPIVVYVETSPTGTEPAVADENYIVTSTTIIIPAGTTEGSVEICPVDNEEENETRTFNVTIVKVEGATIGSQTTTVVGLRDNDSDPYEKMTGAWTLKCQTVFNSGTDGPFSISMQTPDPESEAEYYGHELYGFGLKGYDFIYVTLNYAYNEITDETTMSIQTGSFATTSTINFGFTGIVVGSSQYPADGMNFGADIPLTYGVDASAGVEYWEADPNAMFFLSVLPYPALNQNMEFWDGWADIRFERPLK